LDQPLQSRVEEKLGSGQYDFIEFGCGDGRSMSFAMEHFDAKRGLGIDLSPHKIALARAAGCDVEHGDVTKLHGVPNAVRFVQMKHFLEHLDGRETARRCIESACVVAKEFVYIKGPWFDADSYLFRHQLKLYWSDWVGHGFHLSAHDLQRILSPISKVRRFAIFGVSPIRASNNPALLPLSAPPDCYDGYDESIHGPKLQLTFQSPVYREVGCLVQLAEGWDLSAWAERLRWKDCLYDSDPVAMARITPVVRKPWARKLKKLLRSPRRFVRDMQL
jgi:SAM-dependent methyltransferase